MHRDWTRTRIGRRQALRGLGAAAVGIASINGGLLSAAGMGPRAGAAPPVRIGLAVPLSGPSRRLGAEIAAGFALALAEVDERAMGRPVEVHSRDVAGQGDEPLALVRRLIEDEGIDLLVAAGGSRPVGPGLREAAEQAKIPLLLAAAPADPADRCSAWSVSLTSPLERMAEAAGRWLPANTRLKRLYALSVDSASARQGVDAFGRALSDNGGELVGQELVPERNGELAPYLAKVRLVGPEGVLAIFHGAMADDLERALAASSLRQRIRAVALGWLPGLRRSAEAGHEGEQSWLGFTDYLPGASEPAPDGFARVYRETYDRLPGVDAARGYDACLLIEAALEAVGGHTTNRLAFREALREARFTGARGPVQVDPATGALRHDLVVYETLGSEGGEAYRAIDRVAPAASSSCTKA